MARSGLGTINHTLLTIEALGRRAVPIAGVVMVGPPDDLARENRLAIEQYGRVAVVGEMPMLNPLTPERLRGWAETALDPDGRLMECPDDDPPGRWSTAIARASGIPTRRC